MVSMAQFYVGHSSLCGRTHRTRHSVARSKPRTSDIASAGMSHGAIALNFGIRGHIADVITHGNF